MLLEKYEQLSIYLKNDSNIILYGFNDLAKIFYEKKKSNIYAIIDKDKKGQYFNDIEIISLEDLEYKENTTFVITAINEKYIKEIKNKIIDSFPNATIINLPNDITKHYKWHKFTENIKLTEESQNRLDFFLKSEEIQMSIFLNMIKSFTPDIVLDIGANVGMYTLISHKYFPNTQYYSFEPTPNVLKDLTENINFITKKHHIKVFDIALSSKTEKQNFYDFGKSSGRNGIADTNIHREVKNLAELIQVKSETLDNIINTQDKTYLLKIDTEGHEFDVLQGAKDTLTNNNCIIQLELEHLEDIPIETYLNNINYKKIYTIGPDSYFTNIQKLKDVNTHKNILEKAITALIYTKWGQKYKC